VLHGTDDAESIVADSSIGGGCRLAWHMRGDREVGSEDMRERRKKSIRACCCYDFFFAKALALCTVSRWRSFRFLSV